MATEQKFNLKDAAREYAFQRTRGLDADFEFFQERYCFYQEFSFSGPTQAKQRPRQGKNKRFYTPKETVEFEDRVSAWGKRLFERPFAFPIKVTLSIYDGTDVQELLDAGAFGLVYYSKDDVDNIAKCILDGLNGIAWRDDKQIVDLHIKRSYALESGFKMRLQRCGLSGAEYSTFMKYVKLYEENV